MVCVQSMHMKKCLSPYFTGRIKPLVSVYVGILLWLPRDFSCYQLQRIQSMIQTGVRLQSMLKEIKSRTVLCVGTSLSILDSK